MLETIQLLSPLGSYEVTADQEGVVRLKHLNKNPAQSVVAAGSVASKHITLFMNELHEYCLGKRTAFTVPVSLSGTPFQLKVWQTLRQVPFGQSVSYGELAEMMGSPRAQRAVGSALNKNPVAIIIPCHRVHAAGKKIGGFGMGLETKRKLLELEGIQYLEN